MTTIDTRLTLDINVRGLASSGMAEAYLARLGNRMVREAQARCPVDTGLLRSSIRSRVSTGPGGATLALEAGTSYARWVHEGSRGRPGRPFLEDAARAVLSGSA